MNIKYLNIIFLAIIVCLLFFVSNRVVLVNPDEHNIMLMDDDMDRIITDEFYDMLDACANVLNKEDSSFSKSEYDTKLGQARDYLTELMMQRKLSSEFATNEQAFIVTLYYFYNSPKIDDKGNVEIGFKNCKTLETVSDYILTELDNDKKITSMIDKVNHYMQDNME